MSLNPSTLSQEEARRLMSQLLDGELSSEEAAQLNAYLEENPDQMDWMETQDILAQASFPKDLEIPDAAKTWEAVQNGIATESVNDGKIIAFPKLFRSLSIAAAVAVVGAFAWFNLTPSAPDFEESYASIEFVDTDIPDASPVVYTDEESGWNVVWVEQFSDPIEETS